MTEPRMRDEDFKDKWFHVVAILGRVKGLWALKLDHERARKKELQWERNAIAQVNQIEKLEKENAELKKKYQFGFTSAKLKRGL